MHTPLNWDELCLYLCIVLRSGWWALVFMYFLIYNCTCHTSCEVSVVGVVLLEKHTHYGMNYVQYVWGFPFAVQVTLNCVRIGPETLKESAIRAPCVLYGGTVGWDCTTSWKVVGSIPDWVPGIFHWPNTSCCTMALGLTHPVTEMGTSSILWEVKMTGAIGLSSLLPSCADSLEILGASNS